MTGERVESNSVEKPGRAQRLTMPHLPPNEKVEAAESGIGRNRTHISLRHPNRIICLYDVEPCLLVMDELRTRLRCATHIEIHTEICTRDRSKALSLRPASGQNQNSNKYLEVYTTLAETGRALLLDSRLTWSQPNSTRITATRSTHTAPPIPEHL